MDGSALSVPAVAVRLETAGCVFAEAEAAILVEAAGTPDELDSMVARRASGAPLEHVVGWTVFRGIRFAVDEGLFVPRARSGLLVDEAASLVRCLAGPGRDVVVVDLCCGVGAIGGALAAELPHVVLHSVDVEPRAVACARRNLAPWNGAVHLGDLYEALPRRLRRRTDLVVASPPYVPTGELRLLGPEAREFEPVVALDGGVEGLDLVARIARGARQWLARDGCLALEVGERQTEPVTAMLEDLGYVPRAVTSEEHGAAAVIGRYSR